MKRVFIYILATFYLFSQSGCERAIELDLPEGGGRLVMFAFITPDSALSVHLSRSVSHSSVDDFERVFDGIIEIHRNGVRVDSFKFPYRYTWASRPSILVEPGDDFKFTARDNTGNLISGSTTIPGLVGIESLEYDLLPARDNGIQGNVLRCVVAFNDPGLTRDFYQLAIMENLVDDQGRVVSSRLVDFPKTDPVFYIRDQEGSLVGGIDFRGSFPDDLFNGQRYELNVTLPGHLTLQPEGYAGRVLRFMLMRLSEDYFYYMRSRIVAEYNYFFPILDPIIIHSNIHGGLGLVGSFSVSVDSLLFAGGGY